MCVSASSIKKKSKVILTLSFIDEEVAVRIHQAVQDSIVGYMAGRARASLFPRR